MKLILYSLSRLVLQLMIFFAVSITFGQAPQKMSYQAVIRNASSILVTSAPVGMRISILQGSASGSSVYTETQSITTNANGLASFEIGTGTLVSGNFATINWGNGLYFIKTETDPTGGTTYTITGTSQLSSVPYALFSAGSANGETPGTAIGDMKYWNGTAWVMIPVGTPGQFLQLNASNTPSWNGGTFATVTTDAIANQTYFTDTNAAGGNITNLGITISGGSIISSYGICWSTSPNPTLANQSSLSGTNQVSTGAYFASLNGLVPNTTYYVRAYAINSAGVVYGNQVTFTTFSPSLPTVTTTTATAVTGGTASSGGNVTNDGGAAVTVKGVCWSTSPLPTIADPKSDNGTGTGSYVGIPTSLLLNTTYYVRAYATNIVGTAYGSQISFTTTATPSIGSIYQGGVLAYFLQSGDPGYSVSIPHGIIISQNTIGTADFGCYNVTYPNPFGTAIGDGASNTTNILAGCATIGTAAEICQNLVLNTYSDWFLPSTGEWTAVGTNSSLLQIAGGYATSNPNGAMNQNVLVYIVGSGIGSTFGALPFLAFRMF